MSNAGKSTRETDAAPPDLILHDGKPDRPAIILVHGLGMNRRFWSDPAACQVLGGLANLDLFLEETSAGTGEQTGTPHGPGLWQRLVKEGFGVAAWSQRQPLGPIAGAVAELAAVIDRVRRQWPHRPFYLAGHSRGGLIVRGCLAEIGPVAELRGLITIASPHAGTRLAEFEKWLQPAGALLARILPREKEGALWKSLTRLAEFLTSPAIKELTPESEFLRSLPAPPGAVRRRLSCGGTDPTLFHLPVSLPAPGGRKVFEFPDSMLKIIPPTHRPEELSDGMGDGLVAAARSRLPGALHRDFPANHVQLAYHPEVQRQVIDFLGGRTRQTNS